MIPRHTAQKTAIAITDTVVILKVESTWKKKMSDKNVSFITEKFHCYWHPKINNAHYSFKIFRLFPCWLHFPGYYFITNWRLPYLGDAGNISSMRRFIKIMICHRSTSFPGAAAQSVQPSLFLGEMKREMQQRIQRGERPLPPLFLDQTEARRADHSPFDSPTFPYLRVWMTAPPCVSQGLDPALKWNSRLFEGEIAKFLTNWTEEIKYKNGRSVCKGKLRVISWKPCRGIGQSFEESLREGKLVKRLEIFWMNDNTIIDFFTPYSASFNNC